MSRQTEKVRKGKAEEESARGVGTVALLLGSEGDTEIELKSSPEDVICRMKDAERCIQGQMSCAPRYSTYSQRENQSTRRGVPSGRQGENNSEENACGLAVS